MKPLGVITGLLSEARCFGRKPSDRLRVTSVGADERRAGEAARRLLAQGAGALASFGIAGGLDPDLPAGRVIVSDTILVPDGASLVGDKGWAERLAEALSGDCGRCPVLGVARPLVTAGEKADWFARTGAGAVDMESHAVARVALEAGLPFIAVRAVADPARRSLPRAALTPLQPDGKADLGPLILGLLARPWEIPALFTLAVDTGSALRALRRVALAAPVLALGL